MRRSFRNGEIRNGALLFLALLFTSCASTKNVPYFQDITSAEKSVLANTAVFTEPAIQPDDILSISIFTIDPATSMVVNQVGTQALSTIPGPSGGIVATPPASGFLVDKNGEIDLSIVGKVKIGGLTTFQARDLIKEKAAIVYKDPNVQVRYANFKVTVLGEVGRPASYVLPNERVSVLDALGLAGDLTIFGRRENILLIRENNGKKEFARLNLNSSELFNSPFYYLKQNDVIYVEPNKGKAASLNQARTQTYAIIGTALSVLIVLFSRL
ncbi:polysaccharide biosynthesis/export family protein [Pedobacter cryoconitis]|uniref:Polysaccharide export outer membrane protein n=1 Tax=Pedobacter cryoconitis TaxID=188932 RepID=A0A327SJW9_9SPHI|nr:polysaccharide biosynthesis/export family protein [Pedobacter cryoconitis]RAJ29141.1 polysaccharide export outer membrane protein [Pedobacter cryoconitis]